MAGNTGSIKAGRAFVELFADDNPLYRGLDRAGNRLRAWGANLTRMGATLGAAGGGLFGPMLASLTEVTRRAESLQLFSDRIGENVAGMSALAGGFERTGGSVEQFEAAIENLRVRIAEAADVNGYLLDNLRSLGPASRLAGMQTTEVMYELAESIQRIPNAVNQLRAARGYGLEAFLPQLRRGRAGVDEMIAAGASSSITTEEGRQSIEVMKAAREVWGDFKDTVRAVALSLLPTASGIADLKEKVKAGMLAVRDWIKENRGAIVTLAGIGVGLMAAGAVVTGFGVTVAVVGKGIVLTVATVKAAFAAVLSPLGLIGVGLYFLATETEAGRRAVAGLGGELAGLGERARTAFGAISDAVRQGDWSQAFRIGLAYAKAEWLTFTALLQRGWYEFTEMFAGTWDRVMAGFQLALNDAFAFVATNTVGRLRQMLDGIVRVIRMLPGGDRMARGLDRAARGLDSVGDIEGRRSAIERNIIGRTEAASRERMMRWLRASVDAGDARMAARGVMGGGGTAGGGAMSWLTDIAAAVGDASAAAARAASSRRPGFNGYTLMFDAVKGFGQGGAQAISQGAAYGDSIPQRQLDAMQGINTNTADIPQIARDLNTIASSGRLTR